MTDQETNFFGASADASVHAPAIGPATPQESINQIGVNNEAALLQGGYNPHVADAVAASGSDQHHNEQAAADYARRAAQAIANGIPLSQLQADPNLSAAAQAAIYEQAAQQGGTSTTKVEQQYEEKRQADMHAVQGLMGAMIGAAAGGAAAGVVVSAHGSPDAPAKPAESLISETLDTRSFGQQLAALGDSFVPGSSPGAANQRGLIQNMGR